ncbi:nucleotidyltransferase family protein [Bdellovibrio svalbardensis]|uniref:Nucleotidyltransferase family protein n=1 Tax=Bdellovibrio svalbardensis TaxID=2972972 RepID=A0ABT6DKG3_9BACT|nr:nucleotidyltransferase family protein [Bdellovibrio svalbardensis]MDG0817350.1 nucleotidyltransferase family protein [Bdellovibrio svalbardensis]
MIKFEKLFLKMTSTIREALQVIDEGGQKIALVVDDQRVLLGVVSDGDIRRGLLAGLQIDSPVWVVVNKSPISCLWSDSKDKIIDIGMKKRVQQIPILDEGGRIVRLDVIEDLLKPKLKPNKVVLMAGGLGTRLRPLTETVPKPMLKVGNKPILETIVEGFQRYGFNDFIFCVSYKSHIIEEHFGDGSRFGAHIEYLHEKKKMGTAGPLSLLTEKLTEPFIVMNGDLLTNVDFDAFFQTHLSSNVVGTMGVREYDFQVPYGVVNLRDGQITSIEEKPVHRFFVSAGMYVLSPKVLQHIPKDEYYDMPSLFNALSNSNAKTGSYIIKEYWLDIGRMSDYERAQAEYVDDVTSRNSNKGK